MWASVDKLQNSLSSELNVNPCLWICSMHGSASLTLSVTIVRKVFYSLSKSTFNIYVDLCFCFLTFQLCLWNCPPRALLWFGEFTAKRHIRCGNWVATTSARKRHMLCSLTDCFVFRIWLESLLDSLRFLWLVRAFPYIVFCPSFITCQLHLGSRARTQTYKCTSRCEFLV